MQFLRDYHEPADSAVRAGHIARIPAGRTTLEEAIAGVDPQDSACALIEMRRGGTHVAIGPELWIRGSCR
jgi:hypothetical protein